MYIYMCVWLYMYTSIYIYICTCILLIKLKQPSQWQLVTKTLSRSGCCLWLPQVESRKDNRGSKSAISCVAVLGLIIWHYLLRRQVALVASGKCWKMWEMVITKLLHLSTCQPVNLPHCPRSLSVSFNLRPMCFLSPQCGRSDPPRVCSRHQLRTCQSPVGWSISLWFPRWSMAKKMGSVAKTK